MSALPPKADILQRGPLVAMTSHFHEESSLLCELSHIRKRRTGQYIIQTAICPIKGSIKCHTNSIPAALSKLSCSAGWRCFSYSPPSYPPEQPARLRGGHFTKLHRNWTNFSRNLRRRQPWAAKCPLSPQKRTLPAPN
jgi:hypothetical protein